MTGSSSKSIPAAISRLQDNFTCPPNPDDQIAVIYQDESGKRTFNYSSVIQLSDAIFESINSIVKSEDADGGAGVEFIGVGCAQDICFPSVLLGILRSGHAFYCLDTRTEFQYQQRPLQILEISYMLVDDDWMDLHYPSCQKCNELKVEVVWSMAVIPATQMSHHSETNHIDADGHGGQRKLFILKLSVLNQENDSSTKSSTGTPKYGAEKDCNWAYAIRTSGTTGSRKVVLVPHACICPNLNSLQLEFKLESNDVVFGCAPATFDPSIVDLFLALRNSATILYVSSSIKLNPAKLADVLHTNRVSFMQITPSIYCRFNLEEKAKLFCAAESHVQHIVFGGEKLVDERELRFLLASNRCNIYNIYGTTEVSCWASIAKVDETNVSKVPIGKSLEETELRLFNTQMHPEIAIGSKTRITTTLRECNGQTIKPMMYDGFTFRLTGDSGLYLRNGAGILFNGRFDRVVKRNGYFNDLVFIEDQLMKSGRFSFVHAFQYIGKIYVLYKPCIPRSSIEFNEDTHEEGSTPNRKSPNSRKSMLDLFNCSLPFHSYPDRFIELGPTEVIPISDNGKLDDAFLMKTVLNEESSSTSMKNSIGVHYDLEEIEGMLITFWMRCTNCGTTRQEKNGQSQPTVPSDSSMFFEVGGNSMQAVVFVELVMQMCSLRGTADAVRQEKELFGVLHREPFGNMKQYVYEHFCGAHPHSIEQFKLKSITKTEQNSKSSLEKWLEPEISTTCNSSSSVVKNITVEDLSGSKSVKSWGVPLFGCVDTTVTVLKTIIPPSNSDQIPEAEATLAVVGAHSGIVVAVNLNTIAAQSSSQCAVVWAKLFPDRIAASIGVSIDNEYVFIPCCDCVIYCATSATGRIKWMHRASAMFKSTPVPIATQPPKLLVVSDDAVLTCLDIYNGEVHWAIQPSFRIATTLKPVLIDNEIIAIADSAVLLKIDPMGLEVNEFKQETSSCCTDLVPFTTARGSFIMYGTVFGGIIVLKKDLSKLWMNSCGPPVAVNTPVFHSCDLHEPMIVYTTHHGRFICMDTRGAPLLSLDLETHVHTAPIFYAYSGNGVPSCLLTVLGMDSSILLIDCKEEKVVRKIENQTPVECFSSPVMYGGRYLLWGSRDNYLHISDLSSCS